MCAICVIFGVDATPTQQPSAVASGVAAPDETLSYREVNNNDSCFLFLFEYESMQTCAGCQTEPEFCVGVHISIE
jgi:hypothetical protein